MRRREIIRLVNKAIAATSEGALRRELAPLAAMGTQNKKTAVPSTYRSIDKTCPDTCTFKKSGCYAENGHVGRIQRQSKRTGDIELRTAIAAMVLAQKQNTIARLHVSGDFLRNGRLDIPYIKGLVTAASLIQAKYHSPIVAWSYTHLDKKLFRPYQKILRRAGIVVRWSERTGPGGAIVRPFDELGKLKKYIKCPAQLPQQLTCRDCELCWTMPNHTIVFTPHGSGQRKIREALKVIS